MSEKISMATGRCTCGEVIYRLENRPMFVHCCFCSWCQRETGSDRAVNALLEFHCVSLLQGRVESNVLPTASGLGQKASRCPTCKVVLWSNYLGMGEKVRFVRIGTLDNPAWASPDIYLYTDHKPPWVILPEDRPAMSGFYRLKEHWPAPSLARLKALRD